MGMTCLTRAAAHTSCLFIHHSCLWGHLRPQRAASSASTVERAGLLRARPGHFLPCAHLAGLPRLVEGRVIARHYIDKICCPRYGHLAGRSLRAAGRHATCNLVGSAEGGECKKSIAAGARVPWKMAHRSYCSLSSHSITAHTGVQLLILGYD